MPLAHRAAALRALDAEIGHHALVPVHVELLTELGDALRDLADPNGGTFDAAGDFDRLRPAARCRDSVHLFVWFIGD